MAKNYWVNQTEDGWKAQREGAGRAAGVFDTQREAEEFARDILENNGGGELITQNEQGQIRSKDTINSNDPSSRKDTEH